VKLHFIDSQRALLNYNFKVSQNTVSACLPNCISDYLNSLQAAVELTLLRDVQQSITARFLHGQPPHHQKSARSLEFNSNSSHFFVTTAEEFSALKPHQIHEIFRHRHILVPGLPPDDYKFDRAGLGQLGSLDHLREIQGEIFKIQIFPINVGFVLFKIVGSERTIDAPNKMLHFGTLADLLVTDKNGNRRILNVLDLPLGGAPIPYPPQYL